MTLLAEPPLRTGQRQSVRMTHITRRAEKQVKKLLAELSRDDRQTLVSDLLRQVPYDLCDKITHRERHGLSHYRARCEGAVRICFCRLNGSDVVILDVAKHAEFEEFANKFTGSYGTYVPIEESQVMRMHHSNGISANGISTTKVGPSATPPVTPTAEMPDQNVAEILARLLIGSQAFGARAKSIDDTIVKFMDDARDAAVGKIEGELESIEGRITGQGAAFERLQGVLVGLRDELTTVNEGMVVYRGEVDAHLEAQRVGLSAIGTELVEAIAKRDRDITTITAAVREVEEGLGDYARKVEARLKAITAALAEDRTATLASRVDQLAADKEQLIRRLGEQDARLAGTDNALATCRDEVVTLHASLDDLVVRMDRERQERGQLTLKARWLSLMGAARSAFNDMKRCRFNG